MQEEFEDTKGVIRIRISEKNKQHNGQKKKVQKNKQRSTKHTHKTKDRISRTPLKTGGELRWFRMVGSSCSTSGTRCVLCSCLQKWHGKYLYLSSIVRILNNHTLYMVIICALLVGIVLYSSYSINDPKRGSKQTHKPTDYWYISALKKIPDISRPKKSRHYFDALSEHEIGR